MVAAEIAARVFDLSPREIYRLVEEGAIHFLETPELNVLICLGSFDEKRLSSAGLSNSHLDCTTVFGI